jgi:hypothetical protein
MKKASHLHVTLFFNFSSSSNPSKILVIGIWQPNRLFDLT